MGLFGLDVGPKLHVLGGARPARELLLELLVLVVPLLVGVRKTLAGLVARRAVHDVMARACAVQVDALAGPFTRAELAALVVADAPVQRHELDRGRHLDCRL